MGLLGFFIVLISVSSVVPAQDKIVVELNFKIREERIPAILNYILNNSLEEHDITTQDIVKLSKLDTYDLEQTLQLFDYFNLTAQEAFNVGNLEILLKDLDMLFVDFYNNLTTKLTLASVQIQQILTALEIPVIDFLWALTDKNEDDIYASLRKGIYDQQHVKAALDVAQKSQSQVFTAAKDIILNKSLTLDSKVLVSVLKKHGWSQSTAFSLYKALNLTARDVYDVEKFREIFTNISDSVNQNVTLGVFVGPNSLAVHEVAYILYNNKIDGVTFSVDADGVEVSVKKNQSLGEHIVELISKSGDERSSFIEIASNYNMSGDCYILTTNGSALKVELDLKEFSVEKPSAFQFILGSPLVCNGLLYGLASKETTDEIIFDTFYTEDNPQPEEAYDDHADNRSFELIPSFLTLIFNLLVAFILS